MLRVLLIDIWYCFILSGFFLLKILNELKFVTVPVTGNLTDMLEQYYMTQDLGKIRNRGSSVVNGGVVVNSESPGSASSGSIMGGIPKAYLAAAGGTLAACILVAACTAALLVRRGRRKVALLHKHTALVAVTDHHHAISLKDLKLPTQPVPPPARPCPPPPRHDDSDSETSSIYHEPYKLLPQVKKDTRSLPKKELNIATSKSLDYGIIYFYLLYNNN